MRTLYIVAYPLFLCYRLCRGFDADGHSAIAMTAMSGLKGNTLHQLKRLMNGKDIVDISAWGERVSQKHPSTMPFHFQYQDMSELHFDKFLPESGPQMFGLGDGTRSFPYTYSDKYCNEVGASAECKETGHCLVPMIKHLYSRLIGLDRNKINYPEGIQLTDSDSVKFLVNLIGDLHQPLHFGFTESNAGRDFHGHLIINGTEETISLFEIWEKGLIQKLKIEKPQFWYGGWTHVFAIRDIFDKEVILWKERGIDIIDDWARESIKIMCSALFIHPLNQEKLTNNFNIDPLLEFAWFEILRSRLLIAGARLSIVLNDILKYREGKEKTFRQPLSSLLVNEEDENHKVIENISSVIPKKSSFSTIKIFNKSYKLHTWVRNLLINLGIILSCTLIFIYISRYCLNDNYSKVKHIPIPTDELRKSQNIQLKETSMVE
ncbi:hypothetical protein cand_019860 [Cryptosporidium andersoni]|uniref:S1 P1 nuclease n=1 Tax=Cryptosporidium andersoni TaxID=117008 RepID=A0A1J4MW69_9CRYT|nr:hypothetical protein cand_019860 [Cryptosporidium andersoni]